MAINVTCAGCQSVYPVADNLVGKSIRCKKCGEMMDVVGPAAAPAVAVRPAKAVPAAKPAAAVVDDDDDRPAKPSRRAQSDDDEDDAPRGKKGKGEEKKKSSMPMILGVLVGLVLLGGAAVGGLFAMGMIGGDKDGEVKPGGVASTDPVKPDSGAGFRSSPDKLPGDAGSETVPVVPETKAGGPVVTPKLPDLPAPKAPPTTGITREQLMRGDMDQKATERVIRATVLIEGEGPNGESWTGTGWFGVEEGLVFTNAHVLNMKAPGSKPPAKLTFHTYKPDASAAARVAYDRTIPHARISILGIDRRNDLAVLRISNEANLPPPLKVKASSDLMLRQGMTVFGFPLSTRLAAATDINQVKQTEMSVRATNVTAFRNDNFGRPRFVQFEGSANPGNSGGPIVDAEGNVVCVVVSGIRNQDGTQSAISFGVPTEYVFGLLAGRIDDIEYETAYKQDGGVRIPVTVKCIDPMKRLLKVGLDYWVGDSKSEIRPPGEKKPESAASDLEHKFVDLKYDPATKTAKGELVLPELTAGRGYWAQGHYTNALLPNGYWTPGLQLEMKGPPVSRTPVDLVAKFTNGVTRPIELSNSSDLQEFAEDEGEAKEERLRTSTTIKMTEGVGPGNASAGSAATLGFKYQSLDFKLQVGNRELNVFPKRTLDELNQVVPRVEARAMANAKGGIFNYVTDTRAIPNPGIAGLMKNFSDDVLETLQACSIEMPNRRVNPMDKWEQKRIFRVYLIATNPADLSPAAAGPGGKQPTPPKQSIRELKYEQAITYTYMGTRQRLGTEEAVVKIDGVVNPAPGSREKASGYVRGYANVELNSGAVVLADIESEYEVDSSSKGLRKKVSGISTYKMTRGSSVK